MSRLNRMRGNAAEEETPKAAAGRTRTAKGGGRLVHSGDDIFDRAARAEQEQERQKALRESGLGRVFRFWVPEGESREMIILDADIREGRQFYEHNVKGPDGKWGNFHMCVAEVANCPVCEKYPDHKPYFIAVLTVLDLTPFKIKKGTKDERTIQQSRKLLALKTSSLNMLKDIQDAVLQEHKTFRGTYLLMHRAKGGGQTAVNIGAPKVLKGGKIFDYFTEKELIEEFGTPARKDDKGKIIAPANADLQPFDYDLLFPEPTDEDIEKMRDAFGLGAEAGSKREAIDEWDKKEAGTEEGAAEEDARPARGRGRTREPEPEADKPARASRRSREEPEPAAPARGRRSRAGL